MDSDNISLDFICSLFKENKEKQIVKDIFNGLDEQKMVEKFLEQDKKDK